MNENTEKKVKQLNLNNQIVEKLKKCFTCHQYFPATNEYFYKRKTNVDGLSNYCKKCSSIYHKTYRRKHETIERKKERIINKILKKNSWKICNKCNKIYPAKSKYFFKHNTGSFGLDSYCKECQSVRFKKMHVKKTYGITFKELEKRIKNQNSRCPICKRDFKDLSESGRSNDRYPRIDHNHKTGEIRGILCDLCNRMLLGSIDDNIFILINAIKYLKNFKRIFH